MLKRILCGLLTVAMVLTLLPANVLANPDAKHYGDANNDGSIDLNDVLALRKYLAEEVPQGFRAENADVNVDSGVDLSDLLILKKYLAEWDVRLGPEQVTISFYDGDRLIDAYSADKGTALGVTPSVEKTSKANGIFMGWYLDKEYTRPFYSEEPIQSNTNVYAKYSDYQGIQEVLTVDSFSRQDVPTSHSIIIQGTGDAAAAVTLVAKDGTQAPQVKVADNGNGTYTITAEGGFRAGSSYELALGEGFNFVGESGVLPESVRKATFTVKKEIVDNMKLNEDIYYIADTEAIRYFQVDSDEDGQFDDTVEFLDSGMAFDPKGSKATVAGAGALGLQAGDLLCFYVGTDPKDRVYTGPDATAYVGQPEVYVKVTSVTADAIFFTALGQEEISDVYDIPDVFPLKGTAVDNVINISLLDTQVYSLYGVESPTLDFAKGKLNLGDFVAVYTKADGEDTVIGRITAYDVNTGNITFEPCTAQDILSSRNVYVQPAIRGDQLLDQETQLEIEQIMLSQIRDSGFAEEAAYTLASLATRTDGFRSMKNLPVVLLNKETGAPLTSQELKRMGIGASFELTEGVKLSVELITDGDELHFADGLQLAVGLEAEFEVEAEEGKVVIQINATFIQELEIKPTVDGELTHKEVLGVPVPNGVRIAASVDVKNYTAYDFDIVAYTVGEKEKSTWEKLKNLLENPTEITSMLSESGLIPEKFAGQLETVSDIFEKVQELEKKISDAHTKYKEDKETLEGYQEDLESLWTLVEDMRQKDAEGQLFTKETWAQAAMDLSKTNIAQELLGLSEDGITDGDAGVDNDVSLKSVEELMERYAEMLEKETDWVTLLDQKITETGLNYYVINLMVKVDFIIRANMSIALGSTLEYEVGRRYNFWFQVGLYKPTGGSSTMDLIDESLVFQFYVMGKLEIKMGAKITLGVSLGTSDVAYVGIYAEVGPYVKLYGFFIYTYQQLREAGTMTPVKKVQKMGALYLETGIYLVVGVEASAIKGLFEASYDFLDEEYPILTAGDPEYPYQFSYEMLPDEKIIIRDSDGNSENGVNMLLSDSLRAMTTMILPKGVTVERIFDYQDYYITFSNPNFSLDPETGEVNVMVPDGIRSMDCEMRMTYKYGKLAFSDYDIGISVPLFWTNLSTDELSEYYTATVRVGNDIDGYETVWTKRMLKNVEFQLPTEEQIKGLIGYSELKYTSGAYAEAYDTSTGIIADKVYDFYVVPKLYSITVNGIEGPESSMVFTAKYGESFDFSALEGTGRNDANKGVYTTFHNVTTTATIVVGKDANGQPVEELIRLDSPITQRMAQALLKGITAEANYVDNSVTATFTITGLDHADLVQTLPKGGIPDLKALEELAAENGLAIKDINPAVGPVYAHTVFMVVLGELTGDSYTLRFEENGGSQVADITKVGGALLGTLPVPTRTGYIFGGWYTDNGTFAKAFDSRFMPKENVTLYAKWTAQQYTVSFHINGGTGETPQPITVTYDKPYGQLPKPERTGYGFAGWFTQPEGGTQVTADTKVTLREDQTLYAQWVKLQEIPKDIFSFIKPVNPVYDKNTEVDNAANVTFTPESGATYQLSEFIVEYKLDGDSSDYVRKPKDAGTYIARITRPADDKYAKFEMTYTNVLTIDKAQGQILDPAAIQQKLAYQLFYSNLVLTNTITEGVDYIGDEGCFQYGVSHSDSDNGAYVHWSDSNLLTNIFDDRNLTVGKDLYIWVRLVEGPNYLGDPNVVIAPEAITVQGPKSIWCDPDLTYEMSIKTSDVRNAGTDAMIWTSFDECGDEMDRWNSIDGKNFERDHLDTMYVHAGSGLSHRNSLSTIRMKLKFVPKHTAAGWHCEWISLDVYYKGQLLFEGDQVEVNRWFEDDTVVSYAMTTEGGYVQSNVKLIGYDTLAQQVAVSAASEAFAWSWDGSMTSNIFGDRVYNAYEYLNAPVLSVSFGNAQYDKFITRSINGFTVDRAGLAAAMKANGETALILRTALEFQGIDGDNNVSEECQKFTRNVTFTLE